MVSLHLGSSEGSFQPRPQRRGVMLLLAVMVALSLGLGSFYTWRQGSLFGIGCLFGLTLYHASFGFASSYRKLIVRGEVKGVLAQLLMLAVATLLFAPLLLTHSAQGAVAPVGLQGVVGAFLFGIGMQLGSGCACGTLYTIGAGSSMMLFTLTSFCLGSFWASLVDGWWVGWPRLQPHSLLGDWGLMGLAAQLLLLGGLAWSLWQWRQRSLSEAEMGSLPEAEFGVESRPPRWQQWVFGPWSLAVGGVVLAILNTLTLWIAGRPWGVTWGFTLWTAKLAQALGWDPTSTAFWSQGFPAAALQQNVFADITSVMNLGIILGSALAATLAGRMGVRKPPSRWAVVGALLGGILMGFGARMAFGCNVGAYFSGIASTSWHGWLWITFALLGTLLGIRLRPWFGLSN
ncbi:MAG: YeeE/YedE family protein [Thermostichus sp. BF3_bins_97]